MWSEIYEFHGMPKIRLEAANIDCDTIMATDTAQHSQISNKPNTHTKKMYYCLCYIDYVYAKSQVSTTTNHKKFCNRKSLAVTKC